MASYLMSFCEPCLSGIPVCLFFTSVYTPVCAVQSIVMFTRFMFQYAQDYANGNVRRDDILKSYQLFVCFVRINVGNFVINILN